MHTAPSNRGLFISLHSLLSPVLNLKDAQAQFPADGDRRRFRGGGSARRSFHDTYPARIRHLHAARLRLESASTTRLRGFAETRHHSDLQLGRLRIAGSRASGPSEGSRRCARHRDRCGAWAASARLSYSWSPKNGDPLENILRGLRTAQAVGATSMRCFMGSSDDRFGQRDALRPAD